MRALFDVNMLIAMHDATHIHSQRAEAWWRAEFASGWASCPLTENGFLRITSQPSYPARLTPVGAMAKLQASIQQTDHDFWPDDVSILDAATIDHSRLLGPNQITDIYLLALAVRRGGRLVTFDQTVPLAAVRGAEKTNLVIL